MSGSTPPPPPPGPPPGPPPQQLAQWWFHLHEAREARHKLITQQLPSVVLYNSGQGTKSVSYTRTNLGALEGYIADLERKLGLRRRRAIAVRF